MSAVPAAPDRFRADIQGLRAVAVGLVLLYHAGVPGFSGGYIGVDVFFVISGFLISGHLLDSLDRDGRLSLAAFYARRARRILPASFTVVILTAIAVLLVYPPLGVESALRDAVATTLYVPNIWFAVQETDYLADHTPSPFQHYWSLGVEEQFYLLWPLVLFGLVVALRRRRAALVWLVGIISVLSFAWGLWATQAQPATAFFLLGSRAWELLAGGLVAVAVRAHTARRMPAGLAAAGGWAGGAMVLAAALVFDGTTPFPGIAALLPVAGAAAVIYFGTTRPAGGPASVLSIRPVQSIGLVSYSLYLVHWPLLVVPQAAVGYDEPLSVAAKVLLGIGAAVPLAYLLHHFVEQPLRAPAALTRRRPRATLFATGAVTGVVALTLGTGAVWTGTRDLAAGAPIAEASAPESPPTATAQLPSNLTPPLELADADVASVYADGCHNDVSAETVQRCSYGDQLASFDVAVFGDSHSAQWLPALEQLSLGDTDLAIRAYTKSSCPAVDVTVLVQNVPYESCDRWRDSVIAELTANPPDVVLISSYSGYQLAGAAEGTSRLPSWADGVRRTVSLLRDAGSRVVVIADTPRFAAAPALCISAHPDDLRACAGQRANVLSAPLTEAERRSVETAGGEFVDLSDYLCDRTRCPVVVDNLLVYRDLNHLTATFVRHLAPTLAGPISNREP